MKDKKKKKNRQDPGGNYLTGYAPIHESCHCGWVLTSKRLCKSGSWGEGEARHHVSSPRIGGAEEYPLDGSLSCPKNCPFQKVTIFYWWTMGFLSENPACCPLLLILTPCQPDHVPEHKPHTCPMNSLAWRLALAERTQCDVKPGFEFDFCDSPSEWPKVIAVLISFLFFTFVFSLSLFFLLLAFASSRVRNCTCITAVTWATGMTMPDP